MTKTTRNWVLGIIATVVGAVVGGVGLDRAIKHFDKPEKDAEQITSRLEAAVARLESLSGRMDLLEQQYGQANERIVKLELSRDNNQAMLGLLQTTMLDRMTQLNDKVASVDSKVERVLGWIEGQKHADAIDFANPMRIARQRP